MDLLQRIAEYFKQWDGEDATAPKMELTVQDLRYIASLNVEKCKAESRERLLRNRYVDGAKVHQQLSGGGDGLVCPFCGCVVADKDTSAELRPWHCPSCGAKLLY